MSAATQSLRSPQQIADDTFAQVTLLMRGGSEAERIERATVEAARIASKLLARTSSADVSSVSYLSDLGTAARWAQASEILEARMLELIAAAAPLAVAR